MKRMATTGSLLIVALTAVALLAWADSSVTNVQTSKVVSPRVQLVLPLAGTVKATARAEQHVPGLYKSTPYSMLLLVPGKVDSNLIFSPDTSSFRMPIYRPPMRLTPVTYKIFTNH